MSDAPTACTGHNLYDPTPIVRRQPLVWPNKARIAVGIVVCLEYYEMQPPPGAFLPVNMPGGFGRGPYPDFRSYSHREYGNRVGIFRVMSALDRYNMRATAAVDAWTARHRPNLIEEIRKRDWEFAGHGRTVTQVISSEMTEEGERKYIRSSLAILEAACCSRVVGWHGPEYGESARTPALLAELGVDYVLDWPNDEQPYRMRTASGPLLSVPIAVDLDDVCAHWHRRIPMARWRQSISDALDRMLSESEAGGRMMVLNLHPWLIGQPYRVTYLEEVLADLQKRAGIWCATTGEIAACAEFQLAA
jgi:allantoinase